jgi:hypothetical protein
MMGTVSPGFSGRGRPTEPSVELPPGQYLVEDFPVLSAGPIPDIDLGDWELTITTRVEERQVGPRDPAGGPGRARLLGEPGLPQPRRPLAGAAVLGRLMRRQP